MVWIIPHKRKSKSKNSMFSKYKDVVQTDFFKLQQRKSTAAKGPKHRPQYRIITRGDYPFYEVAYGDDENIKDNEWRYILNEMEHGKRKRMLTQISFGARKDWFLQHFTQLGQQSSRGSVDPAESDDEESGEDDPAVAASVSRAILKMPPRPALLRPEGTVSKKKHLVFVLGLAAIYLNMTSTEWNVRLGLSLLAFLFALSFYSAPVANLFFKASLNLHGLVMMLFGTDKKWSQKHVSDPETLVKVTGTKRLIFIRHGESEWNLIFNKGIKMLLPRLFKAMIREFFMLLSTNSIFFDSPLNTEGMEQADELCQWLGNDKNSSNNPAISEALTLLKGEGGETVITSSPLRRAIQTTTIGLRGRLKKNEGEQIKVLSCLSEISFNVDTIALADAPGSLPELSSLASWCALASPAFSIPSPELLFDASDNRGQKPVRGNGLQRLEAFCRWSFTRKESTIIAGGHSLWFRYFFKTFLPKNLPHALKVDKIPNSGIVMLTLQMGLDAHGRTLYSIDPASVVEVYGNFDTGKKKKKA